MEYEKVVNDTYSALNTCSCLIQVDEEEFTVRFVHPSVRDFYVRQQYRIMDTELEHEKENFVITECHRTMAEVIVTYLSYGVFDTRLSANRVPQIDAGSANLRVVETATATSRSVQSLALKLLFNRNRATFNLGKGLLESLPVNKTCEKDEFLFVHYARQWCLEHICAIDSKALGSHITLLLPSLLDGNAQSTTQELSPTQAYVKAVEKNSVALLEFLIRTSSRVDLNCRFVLEHGGHELDYCPTSYAICMGHKHLVDMMSASGARAELQWNTRSPNRYPMCYVVYCGGITFVKIHRSTALPHQIHHRCKSGKSPLFCAIQGGDIEVVQFMLGEKWYDETLSHDYIFEALKSKNKAALRALVNFKGNWFMGISNKTYWIAKATEQGFPEGAQILAEASTAVPPQRSSSPVSSILDTMEGTRGR
jgi:hypothetical protein